MEKKYSDAKRESSLLLQPGSLAPWANLQGSPILMPAVTEKPEVVWNCDDNVPEKSIESHSETAMEQCDTGSNAGTTDESTRQVHENERQLEKGSAYKLETNASISSGNKNNGVIQIDNTKGGGHNHIALGLPKGMKSSANDIVESTDGQGIIADVSMSQEEQDQLLGCIGEQVKVGCMDSDVTMTEEEESRLLDFADTSKVTECVGNKIGLPLKNSCEPIVVENLTTTCEYSEKQDEDISRSFDCDEPKAKLRRISPEDLQAKVKELQSANKDLETKSKEKSLAIQGLVKKLEERPDPCSPEMWLAINNGIEAAKKKNVVGVLDSVNAVKTAFCKLISMPPEELFQDPANYLQKKVIIKDQHVKESIFKANELSFGTTPSRPVRVSGNVGPAKKLLGPFRKRKGLRKLQLRKAVSSIGSQRILKAVQKEKVLTDAVTSPFVTESKQRSFNVRSVCAASSRRKQHMVKITNLKKMESSDILSKSNFREPAEKQELYQSCIDALNRISRAFEQTVKSKERRAKALTELSHSTKIFGIMDPFLRNKKFH